LSMEKHKRALDQRLVVRPSAKYFIASL
jgi:hypothetical protein